MGFARRAQREWDLPVHVHRADGRLARHPYRYRPERSRLSYPLTHPRSLPVLGGMAAAGALAVRGVRQTRELTAGRTAAVPGRPHVIHTPGHTDGHVVLHLPDRDAVITADALVTLDPYTARTGPQIVASAATADTAEALASLDAIASTGARTLLPGHGGPWHGGAVEAVRRARQEGAH